VLYHRGVERFDAIVVGAGPAGSTTAFRLARAGASVLLLDRARFPRDKPCGGGLTIRAVRELPVDVGPVVEDVVVRMELRLRYGSRFERGGSRPLVLMTQRRRLDHFLAEEAAAAGADFRDGVRAREIELREDGVMVSFDGGRAAAAVLIGADGANGIAARSAGIDTGYVQGVAYEGNVSYQDAEDRGFRGKALIELGIVPGGYGWLFPKGDHANVGVGGWESEGPRLRDHLRRLCREYGIAEARVEDLRGHRLPLRRAGAHPVRGRTVLVGDAAGLVDPLTGDGMYEAFVSSRLASQAILDLLGGRSETLDPYAHALREALASQASASWGAKIALDRFPRTFFALARAPYVWRVVESLIRGDVSHPGAAKGFGKAPLRLVDRLARAAGDPGRPFRAEAAQP
jgi:geranylgeranyl reductase family protein